MLSKPFNTTSSDNPNYRKGRGPKRGDGGDEFGPAPRLWPGEASPFAQAPRVTKTLVVASPSEGHVSTPAGTVFKVALPCEHLMVLDHDEEGRTIPHTWHCRFRCEAWTEAAA